MTCKGLEFVEKPLKTRLAEDYNEIEKRLVNYMPYGKTFRSFTSSNGKHVYKYSSKEQDEYTDYSSYGFRYYNADLARWMNPDPAHQFASPYVFNGNMPHMGQDKDGKWFLIDDLIVAAVSFTVGYISHGASTGNWGWDAVKSGAITATAGWAAWNTGGIANAFAAEAVGSGAVGTIAGATAAGAVGGATFTGTSYLGNGTIGDGDLSLGGFGDALVGGAAIGAAGGFLYGGGSALYAASELGFWITNGTLFTPPGNAVLRGTLSPFTGESFSEALDKGWTNSRDMWRNGFRGNAGDIISRWTWQLPQTVTGLAFGGILNASGQVKSVDYYKGASLIETTWGGEKGLTLGSYIFASKGTTVRDQLFMHEYGHYLQSRDYGLLYMAKIAAPSFGNAITASSPHATRWYEIDANNRSALGAFRGRFNLDRWYWNHGVDPSPYLPANYNPPAGQTRFNFQPIIELVF